MSWRERLRVRRSKMEDMLLADLNRYGLFPLTNKFFCLSGTIPDEYFKPCHKAVYIDGDDVHRNRREKDMELRDQLTKRYKLPVLSLNYKRYSERKRREFLAEILAFVGSNDNLSTTQIEYWKLQGRGEQ